MGGAQIREFCQVIVDGEAASLAIEQISKLSLHRRRGHIRRPLRAGHQQCPLPRTLVKAIAGAFVIGFNAAARGQLDGHGATGLTGSQDLKPVQIKRCRLPGHQFRQLADRDAPLPISVVVSSHRSQPSALQLSRLLGVQPGQTTERRRETQRQELIGAQVELDTVLVITKLQWRGGKQIGQTHQLTAMH